MTVLLITNSLQTGGAEKVFMLQARELDKRGHEVHMLLLFKAGELADTVGIPKSHVHVASMRSVFDIFGFFRALSIVRAIHPDALYSTLNEANLVARLLAFFYPRALLVTREANMADVKPRLYRWSDIVLGWRSYAIVAVSKAVGESVISHAPYLKSRIHVLYNPVAIPSDTTRTSHEGIPARRSLGAGGRLLNVGSLTPKKDQQMAVRALGLLPENVLLTLVGDGQERERLEELARELGIESRITFAGAIELSRVADYYKSHDIFVLTSTREGCPNVVLEALSYRLPVVAFDIPGMAEFVSSEWGVLVERHEPAALAEALRPLIGSQSMRRQMGEAGFAHVSGMHSIQRHVDELVSVLEKKRSLEI